MKDLLAFKLRLCYKSNRFHGADLYITFVVSDLLSCFIFFDVNNELWGLWLLMTELATHIGGVNLKLDDGMRFACNPLFLIDFRALDHQ